MKTATLLFISLCFVFASFVNTNASISVDKNQSFSADNEFSDSMFYPVLGSLHSGDYEKSTIKGQDELRVLIQCQLGYCESDFHVISYEAMLIPKGGEPIFLAVTGNSLTQLKKYVGIAESENRLVIANITIENTEGDQIRLPRKLILNLI